VHPTLTAAQMMVRQRTVIVAPAVVDAV